MSLRLFVGRTIASIRLRRSKNTASTSTRGPRLPPRLDLLDVADDTGSGGTVATADADADVADLPLS